MHINFDTKDITAKEAAGLAALLVTLHGSAVLAALEDVDFGRTTMTVNNTVEAPDLTEEQRDAVLRAVSQEFSVPVRHLDPRAADGHPTETNAAEAFGAAPAGDLDAAGTPWDERIHSGSRGTNKDGTWTRRRNTPDETFDTVMAELKGKKPGPNDLGEVKTFGSVGELMADLKDDPEAAPAAPPPPPPAAPAAPPAPPAAAAPITFPTLMVKITKAQGAGQIDKATVDSFIKELGATSMAQLASQPDKLAELNKLVDTVLGNA